MGLELYKCLVRPHLEFAVAAWTSVQDKGVRLMEKVQYECLRQITGAYCHSSADALDIICNTLPIRLWIQELPT